jgi:DNA-binding CsgD family transcriptional regulator
VFGSRPGLPDDFHAALDRLVPEPPEFLALLGSCFVEPARLAVPMLGRLEAAIAGLNESTDPANAVRIGIAATYVDRLAGCRSALWRVVEHGRAGGAITSAIEAFVLLGYDGLMAGDWDGVQRLVEEGLELTDSHDYKLLGGFLRYDRALIAAARGDDETVRAVTDELIQWAAPSRIGYVLNHASHARSLAALGRGDFEAAYRYAAEIFPGRTLPTYAPHALWVILDLVEAAVRAGRRTDAAEHVAAITSSGVAAISPRLALATAGASAMVASDDDCLEAFGTALAVPGANRWPFHQARIQLAYGERLRRAKSTSEARKHLTAALDTFERLDARPWVTRTSSELRASGLKVGSAAIDSLTPQQREIARLAAAGLTNKQIGERLFLSPRTVGTHLYQLFPKLGITSRAALRDALAGLPTQEPPSTT